MAYVSFCNMSTAVEECTLPNATSNLYSFLLDQSDIKINGDSNLPTD